jgi:Spy/CpxP family protein refolding chaperone
MRGMTTVAAATAALLGSLSLVAAAPTARASAMRHAPTRHVVALEPNYRTSRVDWMTRASRFNIDEGPAAWATHLRWSDGITSQRPGQERSWLLTYQARSDSAT